MDGERLIADHQRSCVGRGPQNGMLIQLGGKDELFPGVTSPALAARRLDPRAVPDISKDLTPVALHTRDAATQEPPVDDHLRSDVILHGNFPVPGIDLL